MQHAYKIVELVRSTHKHNRSRHMRTLSKQAHTLGILEDAKGRTKKAIDAAGTYDKYQTMAQLKHQPD